MERQIRDLLHGMAEEMPPHNALPKPTRRRARRGAATSALVVLLAIGLLGYGGFAGVRALGRPAGPAGRSASPATCEWTRVQSPNQDPSTFTNTLDALAVAGEADVWAVGGYYHLAGEASGPQRPLMLHWDGTEWRIVALPDVGGTHATIDGLAVVSPSDVWAVGSVTLEDGSDQPLALHWEGAAWTEVPTPDTGKTYSHLAAVAAVAPADVWAVGKWATGEGAAGTLVMHWDGAAWSVVPSPDVPPRPKVGWSYPGLGSVVAVGPDDVWAVGSSNNVAPAGPSNTLALRWDGSTWTAVPTPDIPGGTGDPFDTLASVAAASSQDIWAVGSFGLDTNGDPSLGLPEHTLTLHWDGATWSVVSTPVIEGRNSLSGVTARGPDDAWAVGQTQVDASQRALLERWDGTAWTVVPAPVDGDARLSAVAATPGGDLWAVGSAQIPNSDTWGTLVLRAICSSP